MSKVTIKIRKEEFAIPQAIVNFIDENITTCLTLRTPIEKSDSISENIQNGYYCQKEYEFITDSSHCENYKDFKVVVEDIVNDNSTPREYEYNWAVAKKYISHSIRNFNNVRLNDDTWESDFQSINNVSDSVMSAINTVINESSVDEYNKPYMAETVLDAINVGISEALVKTL